MFKTTVFPSFNLANNAGRRNSIFMEELVKTRNQTHASFVCFSIFDVEGDSANQLNFVTFPVEWASHFVTQFYSEAEFLSEFSFDKISAFDWRDVDRNTNIAGLFKHIRMSGLGKNGVSISRPLTNGLYGVVSLCFHTDDKEWPFQLAYHRNTYEDHAKEIATKYESVFRHDPILKSPITRREVQCLAHVAEGKTDVEIAKELGVTKWTVVTHLCNARRKLESPNRASAVAVAISKGLICVQQ